MTIRAFNRDTDLEGLRQCVVSIQNYERKLDPRMPSGEDIVDDYILDLFETSKQSSGNLLVAEIEGEIAGYALLLKRVFSESIDDGNLEYGLLRDVVVLEGFRGRGLGGKLLQAAEEEARKANVAWLRIEVLCTNETAKNLYLARGFEPYTLQLEKNLQSDADR